MLHALDTEAVRRWYDGGLAALDATRDEINSLNVFPVPDADTGTNLHLTLESASGAMTASPAETATRMARQSLLGARGSSGVILSQLLRGVAEVLGAERFPPRGLGLTRALERAVTLAYAAVSRPVEGTMLTVARAAAEAARATGSDDLRAVVDAAVAAAEEALAKTPSQLDVLGRAGVVDAGGRGVVVLLEVLRAVVDEAPLPVPDHVLARPRAEALRAGAAAAPAFEVMYLLDAPDERVDSLRRALDTVGDSVVVSGGDGLWSVHVHADDAAAAVGAGADIGRPRRVTVTPIAGQETTHAAGHRHAAGDRQAAGHRQAAGDAPTGEPASALVIVADHGASALGLREVFAAAGARVVAPGDGLAAAIEALRVSTAVLLADSPTSLAAALAAEKALSARGVDVGVISASAPVQFLAALAVHEPARAFADDVAAMASAANATRHVDVRPDRGRFVAALDGGAFDGGTPLRGDDPCDLALATLDSTLTDEVELVTVVAAAELAARVASRARAEHPKLEVAEIAAGIDGVWLGIE